MEGRRVSHCRCMCVVSHGYGGLGGGRDGGGMHEEQSQGIARMSRDVGALPDCEVIH